MEGYAEQGAHGSLDHFGVVPIDTVGRGIDGCDAEPGGNAQQGAQVTGVADAVQDQAKAFIGQRQRRFRFLAHHRQRRRRGG